jgi:hypothetical protein
MGYSLDSGASILRHGFHAVQQCFQAGAGAILYSLSEE